MKVRLTTAERDSACWHKVEAVIGERLATYRAITENPAHFEADRLGAAWRIKELKELLKLAQPAAEPQQDAG